MSSRKKARRSPEPDPELVRLDEEADKEDEMRTELVRLDEEAEKEDEMRTSELERHNAELAVAAAQRAAARAQRDQEEEVRNEQAMAQNVEMLFREVIKDPVPQILNTVAFFVEYDSIDFEIEEGETYNSYIPTLSRFVEKIFKRGYLFPAVRFSFDRRRPQGKEWSVERMKGAAKVKRDHISDRKVVHFARLSDGGVAGMCSNDLRCYFNEGVNEMRSLAEVQFELGPFERDKPKRQPSSRGAAAAARPRRPLVRNEVKSLRNPVAPAFFAGDFYVVQNTQKIQVKGPALKQFNYKTEYLSIDTAQDDTPAAMKATIPSSVVGLHVWDDDHVILITLVENGCKIYTISKKNEPYKVQIVKTAEISKQSQVAHVADAREQRLFLLSQDALSEFTNGPNGFVKVNTFGLYYLFQSQSARCFCIQRGQLCIGVESFILFYNFGKLRADLKGVDLTEKAVWRKNLDFYVVCKDPREIMFVTPDSNNQVLVSAKNGVELLTL